MALIRALNSAISGILGQQAKIDVTGDNLANLTTTGFKVRRAQFETLLSQQLSAGTAPSGNLGGVDPRQIGLGVKLAETTADFRTGSLDATGVKTDMAIEGDGFFIMRDERGRPVYTRDGSFSINPSNLLHNPANGFIVQGLNADLDTFTINAGGPLQNLYIPVGDLNIARETDNVFFDGNLNGAGDLALDGSVLQSETMYIRNSAGLGTVTANNPLGFLVANSQTALVFNALNPNSGVGTLDQAGQFVDLAFDIGDVIEIGIDKGSSQLPTKYFVIGDPPPSGGATMGDLVSYMQGAVGIDTLAATGPKYGALRDGANGTIDTTSGDVITTTSLIEVAPNTDLRQHGVRAGDYIHFTTGLAAGQVARIDSVYYDTVAQQNIIRFDPANPLTALPTTGDQYVIHRPAGAVLESEIASNGYLLFSGTTDLGGVGVASALGVTTITLNETFPVAPPTNFPNANVQVGDYVRWTSGPVAGIEAVITAVTPTQITADIPDAQFNLFGVTAADFDNAQFEVLDDNPGGSLGPYVSILGQGKITLNGNVGSVNDLNDIELTENGNRVALFNQLETADGESVTHSFLVFDSLGTPRTVNITFVYESSNDNGNVFRWFAETEDNQSFNGDPSPMRNVGSGKVMFTPNGQYQGLDGSSNQISIDLGDTGANTPFIMNLDFTGLTGFSADMGSNGQVINQSEVAVVDQDGFEQGTLYDFEIGGDGIVTGIFDNGLTRTLGQVLLARFRNNNGLVAEGSSIYREGVNSGIAQVGTPGSFARGVIRSGFLEESNVEISREFTNLIVAQRAFQSNARTISVADTMLQELVNLI